MSGFPDFGAGGILQRRRPLLKAPPQRLHVALGSNRGCHIISLPYHFFGTINPVGPGTSLLYL